MTQDKLTYIYDGMTVDRNGRTYRINIERDDDSDKPWERDDGCGIVRESRTPHWHREGGKRPGERPMNKPGRHETQFYFDWSGTMKKAYAEGWGLTTEDRALLANRLQKSPVSLTRGQIVAEAVRKDFEFLSGWVNDQWQYVGVMVRDITDDADDSPDYAHAIWGIESCCDSYMADIAEQLINDHEREREQEEKRERINNRFADAMACGV